MGSIGRAIAPSANLMLRYAELLLKDIRPEQFARLAVGAGGRPIQSNHPAFVYGHLSMYPSRIMEVCGMLAGVTAKPDGWEELFKAGAECRDDPAGTIYPAMEKVTSYFFEAYRAGVGILPELSDELLMKINPVEGRSRETFPTIGAAVAFYSGGHAMLHLGQVSAWRRAMGMASAM